MNDQYLEAFLKIINFLKEGCLIDDNLGIRDRQFQDFIINSFGGFNRSYGLFNVDMIWTSEIVQKMSKFKSVSGKLLWKQKEIIYMVMVVNFEVFG